MVCHLQREGFENNWNLVSQERFFNPDHELDLKANCQLWSFGLGKLAEAVQTSDRGIGLVCKEEIKLAAGQRFGAEQGLYGELVKLDEASPESLVRSKYDSLFEGGHVLVGPLGLANHYPFQFCPGYYTRPLPGICDPHMPSSYHNSVRP